MKPNHPSRHGSMSSRRGQKSRHQPMSSHADPMQPQDAGRTARSRRGIVSLHGRDVGIVALRPHGGTN